MAKEESMAKRTKALNTPFDSNQEGDGAQSTFIWYEAYIQPTMVAVGDTQLPPRGVDQKMPSPALLPSTKIKDHHNGVSLRSF